MHRREFITLLGGMAVARPFTAHAQQAERVRSIGVLMNRALGDPEGQARIEALQQALLKLGWTEGRNVRIDIRWAPTNAAIRRHADHTLSPRHLASRCKPTASVTATSGIDANRRHPSPSARQF